MHHAAAEDLQPARALANTAALAAAGHTADVNLRRWLREREIAWAQTDLHILAKHFTRKRQEHALEIGHRDVLVDQEPFDLVEHRAVGRVVVAAIHTARCDDLDRQLTVHFFHRMHLHARSLGAQHHLVVDVEGVLHIARRMIRWQIQRLEVVVIAFDFRPFRNLKTEASENALGIVHNLGQRVQMALWHARARERHVQRFASKLRLQRLRAQLLALFLQRLADRVTHRVRQLADHWALLLRELAHALQNSSQLPFFAEVFDTQVVDLIQVVLSFDGFQSSLLDLH